MKKIKSLKQSHTSNDKIGKGNNYGPAIKNKMGKILDSSMGFKPLNSKGLKKPPKSLA